MTRSGIRHYLLGAGRTAIFGRRVQGSISDEGNRWEKAVGPLLIFSLIALALGLILPVIRVDKFFIFTDRVSIWDGIILLFSGGEYFIAIVVSVFSVILPLIKLEQAYRLWRRIDVHSDRFDQRIRWLGWLSKWSMVDVFVIALIVFSVKASAIANATTEPGLYFFFASSLGTSIGIGRIKAAADRIRNSGGPDA